MKKADLVALARDERLAAYEAGRVTPWSLLTVRRHPMPSLSELLASATPRPWEEGCIPASPMAYKLATHAVNHFEPLLESHQWLLKALTSCLAQLDHAEIAVPNSVRMQCDKALAVLRAARMEE